MGCKDRKFMRNALHFSYAIKISSYVVRFFCLLLGQSMIFEFLRFHFVLALDQPYIHNLRSNQQQQEQKKPTQLFQSLPATKWTQLKFQHVPSRYTHTHTRARVCLETGSNKGHTKGPHRTTKPLTKTLMNNFLIECISEAIF